MTRFILWATRVRGTLGAALALSAFILLAAPRTIGWTVPKLCQYC